MEEYPRKKHGCLIAFVVVVLVLIGLAAAAWLYLPGIIGRAAGSGKVPGFMPGEFREAVRAVSEEIDGIDPYLKEAGISREQLAGYVQEMQPEQFRDFLDALQSRDVGDAGELLDLAEETIGLPMLDRGKTEAMLNEHLDPEEFGRMRADLSEADIDSAGFGLMFSAAKTMIAEALVSSEER